MRGENKSFVIEGVHLPQKPIILEREGCESVLFWLKTLTSGVLRINERIFRLGLQSGDGDSWLTIRMQQHRLDIVRVVWTGKHACLEEDAMRGFLVVFDERVCARHLLRKRPAR